MYRTAAKRALLLRAPFGCRSIVRLRFPPLLQTIGANSPRLSISPTPNQNPETPNFSDPTSSSASTSSTFSDGPATPTAQEAPRQEGQRPRVEYEDEQARVLRASLPHVVCTTSMDTIIALYVYEKLLLKNPMMCYG